MSIVILFIYDLVHFAADSVKLISHEKKKDYSIGDTIEIQYITQKRG